MEKQKRFSGLDDTDRRQIAALMARGLSRREVAKVMGRSPNTISYELKHNSTNGAYDPGKAIQKSRLTRKVRRFQWRKIEHDTKLREYVICGLKAGWNPDEISGCMKREGQPFYVSKSQIYDWLYSSVGQPYCQYLPSRKYRPKQRRDTQAKRVMIQGRVSITERPAVVADRERPGDYEADTVVSGKRTGSKAALAVCQERKTRLLDVRLIPNLKPGTFSEAATAMLSARTVRLTLSLDNGIENKQHASISAATGVEVYFCDPYASYQKGGVEHGNKMLRRYFPKGCDLGTFDQAFVDAVVDRLNKKPRKILGYKSALQCAVEEGII